MASAFVPLVKCDGDVKTMFPNMRETLYPTVLLRANNLLRTRAFLVRGNQVVATVDGETGAMISASNYRYWCKNNMDATMECPCGKSRTFSVLEMGFGRGRGCSQESCEQRGICSTCLKCCDKCNLLILCKACGDTCERCLEAAAAAAAAAAATAGVVTIPAAKRTKRASVVE